MNSISIGYFADGPWSHMALRKLCADATVTIKFICIRFDSRDPVLQESARELGIDCIFDRDVNSQAFGDRLEAYGCNLFVSMSFNQIFKKRLIDMAPLGLINCHAGKLPFYRGRNILNWALINDEREFGITVHYVDAGIDTGDIISQVTLPITDEDDYGTLLEKSYVGCADILYGAIKQIQSGAAKRVSQKSIHPTGSYCSARRPGDERLLWTQSSREVFNFVRALCHPGPGALTCFGDTAIKIDRVRLIADAPHYKGIPGAVLASTASGYLVKTEDSFVEIVAWSGIDRIPVGARLG